MYEYMYYVQYTSKCLSGTAYWFAEQVAMLCGSHLRFEYHLNKTAIKLASCSPNRLYE